MPPRDSTSSAKGSSPPASKSSVSSSKRIGQQNEPRARRAAGLSITAAKTASDLSGMSSPFERLNIDGDPQRSTERHRRG